VNKPSVTLTASPLTPRRTQLSMRTAIDVRPTFSMLTKQLSSSPMKSHSFDHG
jgi:hypothetical protein